MMKRVGFFLTMVLSVALLSMVAGCGKLEDQEPAAKNTGGKTNGVAVGSTAVTLTDGSSLSGNESKTGGVDSLDGQGTSGETGGFVMRDGTVYEGGIKDHQPHGLGRATNPNGTFQKGEWRDGRPYRISGTWVAPDGLKEDGIWNYDGAASSGTIWWPDGRIYKGEWMPVDGQAEVPIGMGTMTWPDGRQYVGHFHAGKMDGPGKMTWPDGRVQDGTWSQDSFMGPAK
jgi:hypothetical protein